ncbi:MAG: hypothetical protein A2X71_09945 [Thiobacillus sp. GWE1_62_9]|nr:MAG: hypothetical protein A2X71_09945 [Thiobacillus sp. GWE1_62_9]HBU29491.1 hypothetical protein [Thiobacillus sp.]
MMQKTQAIHTRLVTALMAGAASIGFATAATAAGVGVGVNAGAGAQAGGAAGAQMSTSGSANSNAQWQGGATQGGDRAAERMNAKGADVTQPTDAELEAAGKAKVKGAR